MTKTTKLKTMLLTALMAVGVQNGWSTGTVANLPTTACQTLTNGYIYNVASCCTISSNGTTAGIVIPDNSTVTIYIPSGVTLTVSGSGRAPGIYVPSSSTLIITGEGTLTANSGKRSYGNSGGNGGNGYFNNEYARTGYGGTGGAGGYGQGAAIGGYGGKGGDAKYGPDQGNYFTQNTVTGTQAYAGNTGGDGDTMGTVYIMGTVNVTANTNTGYIGSSPSNGSCGSYATKTWNNKFFSGGGGGGGRGGAGYCASYGIAGGGAGGGSGASGGQGGMAWNGNNSNYKNTIGYTGGQGQGSDLEKSWGYANGSATQGESSDIRWGGKGNWGGDCGSNGGDGNLYQLTATNNSVTINDGNNRSATTTDTYPTQVTTTLTLDAKGGVDGTSSLDVYYGVKPANITAPTRAGYTFNGYYTEETEGTQVFNQIGEAQFSISTYAANTTLYAHWTEKADVNKDEGSVVAKENAVVTETDVNSYIEQATADKPMHDLDLSKATKMDNNVAVAIVNKVLGNDNTKNALIFLPKGTSIEGTTVENTPNVITTSEDGTESNCVNLNLVDGTPMVSALVGKTFTAENATYSRTVTNNWGTICLPYAVSSDKTIQYYKLNNIDTSAGVMSFEAVPTVEANTPAVFRKSETGIMTPSASDVTVNVEKSENNTGATWYLVGTYKGLTLTNDKTSNNYYIASNKFWCTSQASSSVSIPAYRAYFTTTVPQAKRSFSIAIWDGDSTTAIGTIDANGEINITGVYPELSRRGKYMQNGKVTIVKNGKKYNTAGQTIK